MNSPMHCPSCSTYRHPGDRFCKKCGAAFNPVSDDDGQPGDKGVAEEQGKPQLRLKSRPCPGCGVQMPQESFFCVHCGLDTRTGKRSPTVIKHKRSFGMGMPPLGRWASVLGAFVFKAALFAGVLCGVCYFAHRVAEDMGCCSGPGPTSASQTSGMDGGLLPANDDLAAPDRYAILYELKSNEFVLPETNQFVQLELRAGGQMQGRLVEISTNAVMLEQGGMVVGCLRHALTPAMRVRYFRADYAAYHAKQAAVGEGTTPAAEGPSGNGNAVVSTAPGASSARIECPCCGGEGYYMIRMRPPAADVREVCPVCHTRGTAIIKLPSGMVLCPDCRGWGKTWYYEPKSGREDMLRRIATRYFRECRRCSQHGLVKQAGAETKIPSPVFTAASTGSVPVPASEAPSWLPIVRVFDGFWHQVEGWYGGCQRRG
jgi:hypothetical protein